MTELRGALLATDVQHASSGAHATDPPVAQALASRIRGAAASIAATHPTAHRQICTAADALAAESAGQRDDLEALRQVYEAVTGAAPTTVDLIRAVRLGAKLSEERDADILRPVPEDYVFTQTGDGPVAWRHRTRRARRGTAATWQEAVEAARADDRDISGQLGRGVAP